jgi:hypothetical protein
VALFQGFNISQVEDLVKDVFAKQDKNKAVDIFQVGNITKLSTVWYFINYVSKSCSFSLFYVQKYINVQNLFFFPLKANFNPSQGCSSCVVLKMVTKCRVLPLNGERHKMDLVF